VVKERYEYDPFGNLTILNETGEAIEKSSIGNPITYTGQRYDADTGLYYYKNRYYSPKMGRFLTKDPLGMIDVPNLYAYVVNDPINYIDPMGTQSAGDCPMSYVDCDSNACHEVNYDDYFKDSSPAKLPATGNTEIVFYEGARDSQAFGAHVYVVDAEGNIIGGPYRGNTLPQNPEIQATIPEGDHPFRQGTHTYPSSGRTVEALNLGSYNDEGEFRRITPLGGPHPNPNYDRDYATHINLHPGSKRDIVPADRWSAGCQTINQNDWNDFWEDYNVANRNDWNINSGEGRVNVIRR